MKTLAKSLVLIIGLMLFCVTALAQELTPKEKLGKLLYYDSRLSSPKGMSCATCHDPSAGYADPRPGTPTSQGAFHGRYGSRNAPTASYALGGPSVLAPYNGTWAGGVFWDGREDTLAQQAGGPLLNPLDMNNPTRWSVVNLVQKSTYADQMRQVYGRQVFGNADKAFLCLTDAIEAYEKSSEVNPCTSKFDAYMAGETTYSARERLGMMVFSGQGGCTQCHFSGSMMGRKCSGGCACGCVYTGVCTCADCACGCPKKGQTTCSGGCKCGCGATGVCTCASCVCACLHSTANTCAGGCACGCAFTGVCKCGTGCSCGCPSAPQACEGGCSCGCWWTHVCNCGDACACGCPGGGMLNGKPLFTNHGYFNLGVPKNLKNPFYAQSRQFNPKGYQFVDLGLGGYLWQLDVKGSGQEFGKFKVPSLRNVAKSAPYMHNGVFPDLKTVIRFYSTRDVKPSKWAPPEVNANIFKDGGMGNLCLSEEEIDALVTFLGTLSDGYVVPGKVKK